MKIAIASGKGGTGKTTLATSLARALASAGRSVAYLDCDVEEPNGHIFLAPVIESSRDVTIPVPKVDESACVYCGDCGATCRYSAILVLLDTIVTFPELCHGCGGCTMVCPVSAITEIPRVTGKVEAGMCASGVHFVQGLLSVGEAMSPPVIRAVIASEPEVSVVLRDAPPGTSCPVIESVRGADVVLLVTEPTPFGLNDLKLAVEMVRTLGLPFGVVVNRAGVGDSTMYDWCASENVEVLLEIPDDREVARLYSRGEPVFSALPWLEARLVDLVDSLETLAKGHSPAPPTAVVPFEPPSDLPVLPSERPVVKESAGAGIKEIVVLSGKGGTGKTSVVASLFALSAGAAVADCDVDAADLHLVLSPEVTNSWPFSGSMKALVDEGACTDFGTCRQVCRFDAIHVVSGQGTQVSRVDGVSCEGCGLCARVCPAGAVSMVGALSGEWFESLTRHGPMVHARLAIAGENSGKLVSLVRREARAVAIAQGRRLLYVDGSPGIGCPVIASITGASMVLVVAEPTLSGMHDMKRVAELTRHFKIRTVLCVNKADINEAITERIEAEAIELGLPVLGRICYDPAVTEAQVRCLSVVELGDSPAARDMRAIHDRLHEELERTIT